MTSPEVLPEGRRSIDLMLADEVRVLLARRRMRASGLAPVLGKSQQLISQKMAGKTRWSLAELDALARFFGVDANALLPGIGKQGCAGLPHLDSNQEPADEGSVQVKGVIRGGYLRLVTVRDAVTEVA